MYNLSADGITSCSNNLAGYQIRLHLIRFHLIIAKHCTQARSMAHVCKTCIYYQYRILPVVITFVLLPNKLSVKT